MILQANVRSSPVKNFFSRSSTAERKDKTSPLRAASSSEQEAVISPPKSPLPLLRTFPRAPRRSRHLAAGARTSESTLKAVLELGDLIKLQTANPQHTLQRLAACNVEFGLSDAHRAYLLETAKLAVRVAHSEFNRASHAVRQRACRGEGDGGAAFEPAPRIPFADVTDLQTFARATKAVADELANSVSNFDAIRGARLSLKRAAEVLETVTKDVTRGGARAKMKEVFWAVERKCMYWDAVAMMDARIGVVRQVEAVSRRSRRHSG